MDYTVTRGNLAAFAQLVAETLVRRVFAGKERRKITHEQFVIVTANAVVECFGDVERTRRSVGGGDPTRFLALRAAAPPLALAPARTYCGCGHARHTGYACEHRDADGVPCDCGARFDDDSGAGDG